MSSHLAGAWNDSGNPPSVKLGEPGLFCRLLEGGMKLGPALNFAGGKWRVQSASPPRPDAVSINASIHANALAAGATVLSYTRAWYGHPNKPWPLKPGLHSRLRRRVRADHSAKPFEFALSVNDDRPFDQFAHLPVFDQPSDYWESERRYGGLWRRYGSLLIVVYVFH